MHFSRAKQWVFLVLLFIASLPAVTVRFYASDEIEYFAYLRSMWFDGDLSFDNEYRYFYDRDIARAWRFKETFLDAETPTGLRTNFAPVGSALLWAPMYALADAGVRVARAFGSPVAADGFSKPYIAAIVYGSAVYGFSGSAVVRLRGPKSCGGQHRWRFWRCGSAHLFSSTCTSLQVSRTPVLHSPSLPLSASG